MTKHKSIQKRPNISPEERKAFQNLRKDRTIKIPPADNGRATVIMNATEYDNNIPGLLADVTTYEKLKKDYTRVYKSKLVNTMKEWKRGHTL